MADPGPLEEQPSRGHPPRRFRLQHARFWEVAIGAATAVVVLLLVLVGSGILVRPAATSATVTIEEVQWVIQQGTTSRGYGWFGPSYVNVTDADGLPIQVRSGAHVTVSLILANLDVHNHTVQHVSSSAPFAVATTNPTLPGLVPSGEDDWDLAVTVTAPSVGSDTTYTLVLTVSTDP